MSEETHETKLRHGSRKNDDFSRSFTNTKALQVAGNRDNDVQALQIGKMIGK